jgi:hypothetical protein
MSPEVVRGELFGWTLCALVSGVESTLATPSVAAWLR